MEAELFKTAQPVQKIPFGTGKLTPSMIGNKLTIRSQDGTTHGSD
jgi:hypothetical protein